VAGILIAFGYRETGLQRKVYQWDDEDDEMEYIDDAHPSTDENAAKQAEDVEKATPKNSEDSTAGVKVNYIFREGENNKT